MRNFELIAVGLDVVPLLLAIKRRPELFKINTLRQDFPGSPHKDTESIILRWQAEKTMEKALDEHENVSQPAYLLLPEARQIIMQLMARVGGERLGRAMIVRLPPGGHIPAHVDTGSHAEYYDRFHVVLQSKFGNKFRCGGEIVEMQPGQIWWFQNKVGHEVINNSDEDRLHLIVDIRLSQ